MTEVFVKVKNATVETKTIGLLTSGMVGVSVQFEFDSAWDGLSKIAVFQCGDVVKDCVLDVTGKTTVPHETLTEPGGKLYVGVEGRDGEGNLVMPTTMAFVGRILVGADPLSDASTDPSLPVWAQIIATGAIYSTQINEAGELEITLLNGKTVNVGKVVGDNGVSVTHRWDGTVLEVTSASGTSSANLKGAKGDRGDTGAPGYTPQKSVDYYTEADKTEMVEAVLAALPKWEGGEF